MKKHKNILITIISAILAVVTFFVYYKEDELVYIYIGVAFVFGSIYFAYKYIVQLKEEAKKKLKNNPEIKIKKIKSDETEYKNEKLSNRFEKIAIRYPDGKVRHEVAAKTKAPQGYCFYSDDSKTYHTHADCYVNWKPEYRKSLLMWNCIKTESAIKYGYKKCKFCEMADSYEKELSENQIKCNIINEPFDLKNNENLAEEKEKTEYGDITSEN